MYSQNQQPTLPYPVNGPTSQFLSFTLNNLPFIPAYNGVSGIQYILPVVTLGAINEIQNKARTHLRMFMYNQMSSNGYRNQDFSDLVTLIMDKITLDLQMGVIRDPEVGIEHAIVLMCELYCGANVAQYPALSQCIDSNMFVAAQQAYQKLMEIVSAINQMKNNNIRTGYQQGQQPQQYYQQPFQQQQPFIQGGFPAQSSAVMGNFNTGGRSVFGGIQNTPNVGGGKYSADVIAKKQEAFNQPIVKESAMNEARPDYVLTPVNNSKLEWRPVRKDGRYDPNDYYFPAHDIEREELFYSVNRNGDIAGVVIKQRSSELMDEERHRLNTVFGPVNTQLKLKDLDLINAAAKQDILRLNNAVDTIQNSDGEIPEVELQLYVDDRIMVESSLSDAWTALMLSKISSIIRAGENRLVSAYRGYFIIAEAIFGIGPVDDKGWLDLYYECSTFTTLRESMEKSASSAGIAFWTRCNLRMTQTINRMLKEEMSLPGVKIDSFVSDIDDLIRLLRSNYGDFITNCFLREQKSYIRQAMCNDVDCADTVNTFNANEVIDSIYEKIPYYVTYLYTEFSLTYLDVTSAELGIDLAKNTAAVVRSNGTNLIYTLLDGIFKDNIKRNNPFVRSLIKTKDDRVLSACRGLVNPECYLLTLVE